TGSDVRLEHESHARRVGGDGVDGGLDDGHALGPLALDRREHRRGLVRQARLAHDAHGVGDGARDGAVGVVGGRGGDREGDEHAPDPTASVPRWPIDLTWTRVAGTRPAGGTVTDPRPAASANPATAPATPTTSDRVRQVVVTVAYLLCLYGSLLGSGVFGNQEVEESSGGSLSDQATHVAPGGPAFS